MTPPNKISKTKFYITVALLLIFGIILSFLDGTYQLALCNYFVFNIPGHPILPKVGEAFIIAAALAVTVDFSLKKELTQEVIEKVSTYFVGLGLPKQIIQEIDYLRELPFYLDDVHIEFELFAPENQSEEIMNLETKFRFRVRNRTSTHQLFNHHVGQFTPLGKEKNYIKYIGANNISYNNDIRYQLDTEEIEEYFNQQNASEQSSSLFKGNRLWRFWERRLEIPPETAVHEHEFPRFWASIITEVPKGAGYHTHVFSYAVLGLECTTVSNVEDMFLYAAISHRNATKAETSGLNSQTLDAAFLPGQVIFVRWGDVNSDPQRIQLRSA